MEPEKAHHYTFSLIKKVMALPGMKTLLTRIFRSRRMDLGRELMGLHFPNPVGLAAGFDKDGLLFEELAAFGFGFIEVGTVTPRPQPGNPSPRMFRLPDDQGLINRMGFNNAGVDELKKKLKKRKPGLIIGGNIGKNKDTPNEQAFSDYSYCFEQLFEVVDYFVVNVSSPNTPGLRALQEREPLTQLLQGLMNLNRKQGKPKPLLLKIAPDLSDEQLDEILDIVKTTGLDGIIATNTTIGREGLKSVDSLKQQAGGLSGRPLTHRSTEVISYLRSKGGKNLVIIGVGGIFNAADVKEKLNAGADLVQVYTGFIYEGPGMVRSILKDM
jgi:dihydroorotate dehydrogenase